MYPTLEEVEKADQEQLGKWMRFLKSPGESAIGSKNFDQISMNEAHILRRICERFQEGGGWTPTMSKKIGW